MSNESSDMSALRGRYAVDPYGGYGHNYDVTSDGEHLVMINESEQEATSQIRVVLNWTEEWKRRVPTD